ncbi:hypothetical protein ZHAS_00020666 [Anopheles sinensis]|uniref:Uncharacterized protein n=1 Tax=Anopheles sinensis TaxID=74873 RepID=A0A084WQD9_ANOSI|nr:hypothetical protein ZHAS_00020666 [Anopheles sinensis]
MNDIKQAKGRLALPFQHEPPGAEEVTVVGVAGKILPEASTNTNQPGDAYRRDDAAAEAVVTTATITTITTTTSHEKDDDADDADENPTQIDTVTLKCDLNDYLINLITVRCSLAQSKLETAEQAQATTTTDECPAPENGATTNPDRHANVGATIPTSLACSSLSSYIPFDELVRYTELEREWTRKARSLGLGAVRRLRLCGGGEDSINNGTSAWGTPPGPASNGALSAWGVLPNQSLPPPAWGNALIMATTTTMVMVTIPPETVVAHEEARRIQTLTKRTLNHSNPARRRLLHHRTLGIRPVRIIVE